MGEIIQERHGIGALRAIDDGAKKHSITLQDGIMHVLLVSTAHPVDRVMLTPAEARLLARQLNSSATRVERIASARSLASTYAAGLAARATQDAPDTTAPGAEREG